MSESIKSKPVAKRVLKGVHFNFPEAHVAYTSGAGAASMMNDPFLLKSVDASKPLTKEQKTLLKKMGYDISEVEKSMAENTSGLSSSKAGDSDGGEPENLNKGNEENMSEQHAELLKQVEDLKHEVAVEKAIKTVGVYALEEDVTKELADAVATMETSEKEAVIKALDFLKGKVEAAETAKTTAEAEVQKSKATEENPLAKTLDQEAGEGGEAEVQKSFADRVAATTEQEYKGVK